MINADSALTDKVDFVLTYSRSSGVELQQVSKVTVFRRVSSGCQQCHGRVSEGSRQDGSRVTAESRKGLGSVSVGSWQYLGRVLAVSR